VMSYDPMTRLGRISRCAASARVTAIMNERFFFFFKILFCYLEFRNKKSLFTWNVLFIVDFHSAFLYEKESCSYFRVLDDSNYYVY
jgi:hypothetical protein